MTIFEFYIEYLLTRKAKLISHFHHPLDVSISNGYVYINHIRAADSSPIKIPYEDAVTCLSNYPIKILLAIDPVFLAASALTGIISIPVPEPDALPF